ncbi:MAG: serine hydrolase domain-containing protein [Propionibacteriaceae bacterium]|nr:serine hydrolase domain-containing protein [Propionibacteriaceae bacterium]
MDATVRFATALRPRVDKLARTLGRTPHIAVHAPSLGLAFEAGDAEQPFHSASVAKLVTAALVMQCVEADGLTTATPVGDVLPAAEIDGLFLPGPPATVEHLLTHTSGVADYFDGKVTTGVPVVREALAHPQRQWTPADLIAVTRERQRPVGAPGQRFAYSDTGFVLLGRILEQVTGESFVDLVHQRVFDPIGLTSAFWPHRSQPASGVTELAPLVLRGVDASTFPSMTLDWAAGGFAATAADHLRLGAALHDGTLVSAESMAYMTTPRHRVLPGLEYGAGAMRLRVERFVPWLRGYPRPVGHIGVTAAHLWHDPATGADIVINLGNTRRMVTSFRLLFRILGELRTLTQRSG